MNTYSYTLNELPSVVTLLLNTIKKGKRIFLFEGPLGAGKTTLVKALCAQLGVEEPVVSPTYSYVNTYALPHGKVVHHFDLYRLSDITLFYEYGFDELLLDTESIVLIEWPQILTNTKESFDEVVAHIHISYKTDSFSQRYISIS